MTNAASVMYLRVGYTNKSSSLRNENSRSVTDYDIRKVRENSERLHEKCKVLRCSNIPTKRKYNHTKCGHPYITVDTVEKAKCSIYSCHLKKYIAKS